MKPGERSLGESSQARDYDWIESFIGSRATGAPAPEDQESVSVIVGSDLLRTILFTILLGSLAGLMAYFSIGVAAGKGRSIFLLTATLAAFLASGAAATRRRKSLRLLLALGSLCAFAFLVDQLVYYHWHKRVDRLVAALQRGVESGAPLLSSPTTVRPTSFRIDPDQEVLLTFEPPLLVWTHQLSSASWLGHSLIEAWHRVLSRVTRGRHLDGVARTLVRPHEAFSVRVTSPETPLACQEGGSESWTLTIDRRAGFRPH